MGTSVAMAPFMSQPVRFSSSAEIFQAAEQLYSVVERRISAALPNAEIRHVGSTAIYGCLTKGDLDVLVRVDQERFQEADRALSKMFARNEGSDRTDSFSAFADKSASPDLGVQLVVQGSAHDKFTDWIDRLKNDEKLRVSYDDLKARFHGKDMNAYRVAKDEFISRYLGKCE
jgi:GrpB-like predicted nucleotidyltransferase (UPF0157 family)